MGNMHLLEHGRLYLNARKRAEKGREGEESDGKKDVQYAFIRSRQARYVKAGRVRKVTERKMGNKHLLEACKAKHVKAGR
jgi:hypothetical protein